MIAGSQFYEQQEKGLGHYFLDALFSDIDSLLIYAGVHEIHYKYFYRMQSKRFPFLVYYKVNNIIIQIYAILDSRRNPAWIRKHMETLF